MYIKPWTLSLEFFWVEGNVFHSVHTTDKGTEAPQVSLVIFVLVLSRHPPWIPPPPIHGIHPAQDSSLRPVGILVTIS